MMKRLVNISLAVCGCLLPFGGPWPVRVRKALEKLDGAFVKLGQILALRSDVLPGKLALEFLNLLDSLPPMPQEQVAKIISIELGKPVGDYFQDFEWQPLATASFAQVHKARLWSGEQVAVKIQKPELLPKIKIDMKILSLGAKVLDFLAVLGAVKAEKILEEFSHWTLKELDYKSEAEYLEFFGWQAPDLGIKVPKIYWPYSTGKMLVEEYMEGISMKTIIEQSGLLPEQSRELSFQLIKNSMHQYFLVGKFHGDPHASNILFSQNDEFLTYVDFGIVGESQKAHRVAMGHFVYHAFHRNYEKAISAFLHLGFTERLKKDWPYLSQNAEFMNLFSKHFPTLRSIMAKRFANIMARWEKAIVSPKARFTEKSAARTFMRLLQLAKEYKIFLHKDIVLFIKTLIAVDALSLKINPKFNLVETANAVFGLPEYAEIFSKEAILSLNQNLPNVATAVNMSERGEALKNYYREWFYEIFSKHRQVFKY